MEIRRKIKNWLVINKYFASGFRRIRNLGIYRNIILSLVQRFDTEIRNSREYNIAIETTNFCNAACVFCPHTFMARKKLIMDDKTFELVIARIKEDRIKPFGFCMNGTGEPLIDKNIFARACRLKKEFSSAIVKIHTNFNLATPPIIDDLLSSGLDEINISVNGYKKENYENAMHLDFDRTITNVHTLIEKRRQIGSNLKIRISMVLVDWNEGDELCFLEQWSDKVDSVSVNRATNYGNTVRETAGNNRIDPNTSPLPCRALWDTISIASDGRIMLCCMDSEGRDNFGNIKERSILDIYLGDDFRKYRDKHLAGNLHGLTKCSACSIPHDHGAHWFFKRLI